MYLTQLYPTPRSFSENEDEKFFFGSHATIFLSFNISEEIRKRITYSWKRFTCNASSLSIVITNDTAQYSAYIGENRSSFPALHENAYQLHVDRNGIALCGGSQKAFVDGFMILLQLIVPISLSCGGESFAVASCDIMDEPKVNFRAIHLCVFPESERHTIEKAINLAGFLHLTHIVLEFWGTFPYQSLSSLHWKDSKWSRADIEHLIRLAHSYKLEVIPMINHFGHATSSRSCYGRHVVLDSDPRLSLLFEPDGWTWCSSNPDTYRLLSEMRAEMIELCGEGSYFHLGFDEAYSFATCPTCRKRIPHELLAEYTNRLTEDLLACGRRPIIWHDMFVRHDLSDQLSPGDYIVANGEYRDTSLALPLLNKKIIMADWQYGYFSGKNPTAKYLRSLGFDVLLSPWDDLRNISALCTNAQNMDVMGVILTTWDHLPAYLQKIFISAEHLWQDKHVLDLPTERACILRRVYDAEGDFNRAGWNKFEVEG